MVIIQGEFIHNFPDIYAFLAVILGFVDLFNKPKALQIVHITVLFKSQFPKLNCLLLGRPRGASDFISFNILALLSGLFVLKPHVATIPLHVPYLYAVFISISGCMFEVPEVKNPIASVLPIFKLRQRWRPRWNSGSAEGFVRAPVSPAWTSSNIGSFRLMQYNFLLFANQAHYRNRVSHVI